MGGLLPRLSVPSREQHTPLLHWRSRASVPPRRKCGPPKLTTILRIAAFAPRRERSQSHCRHTSRDSGGMRRGTYRLLRALGKASRLPWDAPGTGGSGGAPRCGTGELGRSLPPGPPRRAQAGVTEGAGPGRPRAVGEGAKSWAWSCGRGLTDCAWQRRRGPTLVVVSWVPVTLGSPAAGRCAGVTGPLFRAPHSGPGNVRGAGALSGTVRTPSTASWSSAPRNQTLQPRPHHPLNPGSYPSQGAPTRSPSPPVSPPRPGTHLPL